MARPEMTLSACSLSRPILVRASSRASRIWAFRGPDFMACSTRRGQHLQDQGFGVVQHLGDWGYSFEVFGAQSAVQYISVRASSRASRIWAFKGPDFMACTSV